MKKKLRRAALIVLLVYVLCGIGATHLVYSSQFHRVSSQTCSAWPLYTDVAQNYPRREVHFDSGETLLTGWIYGESGDALVIQAHGLGATAETYLPQTMWFVDHGYCVLTYDATGTGASEGKTTCGLSQSAIDLDAALNYVAQDTALAGLPVLLFGHSWGGYGAAAVLKDHPEVSACASLSAYDTPFKLMCEQAERYCGPVCYLFAPFVLLHERVLFGAAANRSASEAVRDSGVPVLVVHGDAVKTVRADGAALIARTLSQNAQTLLLEGETHMSLLRPHTREYADYTDKINADYSALYADYDGEIPEEIRIEFYAGVDKTVTGGVWQTLMERIDGFYRAALR